MTRTLDRYVLREFVSYLTMALLLFVGLFVVVDVFEKIDLYVDNRASPGEIAMYYLNTIPMMLVLVGPVGMLLGCLLTIGQLGRTGELVAMLAAGVSYFRILAPMLAFGFVASGVSFALAEWVMPEAAMRAESIMEDDIRGRSTRVQSRKRHVTYMGREGRLFYVKTVDPNRGILRDVVMQAFDEAGDLVFRVDAREASQENGLWLFRSGHARRFSPEGEAAAPFRNYWTSEIPETANDFMKPEPDPMSLGRAGLANYIQRLRESGARTQRFEVEYHLKLAFPLVNLIIVLLGASLSAQIRRTGFTMGFGLSIFLGFSYLAFVRVGQAVGYNGGLPPLMAAWLGNLVFLAVAIVFQIRANR